MHVGERLWPSDLTKDMVDKKISDKRWIRTYPDLPQNMYAAFTASAGRLPDKEALVDNWKRAYTYRDLSEKIQKFSSWLYLNKDVRKGRHVALMLYNSVEFCVAFLSLNRIGAVVIPLPTKYKKEEILSLMEKSSVDLVISDEQFAGYFDSYKEQGLEVCEIPDGEKRYALEEFCTEETSEVQLAEQEAGASDMALLMFTSGTTSLSKGVTIRNYNVMHAIISYQRTLGINENDRAIIPVPIYLITGLVAVFGLMMHVGGTVYLNKFFEAERVLEDIQKNKITFLHASPTVFTMLLGKKDEFEDLPGLRMFACGSSNMPPGKIRMLHKWLPNCEFRTIYGLTETTSPGTVFPMDANESSFIGSSGIPIPGLSFKVTDSDGNEVPDGIEGEVWVKGSNITENYYHLQTSAIQDGWLNTGDIGYFNSEGYLYIVDRKKDMINRGGEKICSFDVENELINIEGVEDAAVVGIQNELYGEVPVAVVKLKQGSQLDETAIKRYLKEKMASYKIPVRILAVDNIPITKNMKTDKKKIRQLFN